MKEILRRKGKGLNGVADNNKGSIEVLLEGDENEIIEIRRWIKEKENRPKDAKVSQITKLQFLKDIYVPKASEYSQVLTFEQLGKGVPILDDMGKTMKDMGKTVKEGFEKLPGRIAEALRKLK